MNSGTPEKSYILTDFISQGKSNEVSMFTSVISYNINNIVLPHHSIFDRYQYTLDNIKVKVKLTDVELQRYRYNPKLLSYHLYNTIELWFILLKINGFITVREFNKSEIYIIHPDNLDIINKIVSNEKSKVDNNKSEVGVY